MILVLLKKKKAKNKPIDILRALRTNNEYQELEITDSIKLRLLLKKMLQYGVLWTTKLR